jgi:hypothetical protein
MRLIARLRQTLVYKRHYNYSWRLAWAVTNWGGL